MAGEKSATFSGQMLALWFNGTTVPNLAINATSSPLTNLYVSLHTADPTAAGTQTTNEVAYTSYARVAVARTTGGWTVNLSSTPPAASPVSNVIWPNPTGAATQVATFVAVGTLASGAGTILYAVPLSPSITITLGIPPTITPASTFSEA